MMGTNALRGPSPRPYVPLTYQRYLFNQSSNHRRGRAVRGPRWFKAVGRSYFTWWVVFAESGVTSCSLLANKTAKA